MEQRMETPFLVRLSARHVNKLNYLARRMRLPKAAIMRQLLELAEVEERLEPVGHLMLENRAGRVERQEQRGG